MTAWPAIVVSALVFVLLYRLADLAGERDNARLQARRLCELLDAARADRDALLALDVDLRDEDACSRITPEGAARYLAAEGWRRVDHEKVAEWHRGEHVVSVPHHDRWPDYGRCMRMLVRDLAQAEQRTHLAVWADLVTASEET